MCGISGVILKDKKQNVNETILRKMNELIAHRGPDYDGIYTNNNIGFGHRRLSIIGLEEESNQPFIAGDLILIFNGEIYNYKELKNILKDYDFRTNSDTEVILASYLKWGTKCVEKFKGMWSFCIYDLKKKILFCSRDRFGIKPFYYFDGLDKFVFASEIKQFTALAEWKAVANVDRLKDFILFEMIDHTQETMFKDVYQLQAGHNLIYDIENNCYNIYKYYDLIYNIKRKQEYSNKELLEKFEKTIEEHMQSDVKLGSCLSGGLDSSSIVMMVNRLKNNNVKQEVVSSCFENKKYDEQEFIDEVVGSSTEIYSHKVYPKISDLFLEIDKITWHQDEPFGSTSIFAQWSVFKEAKRNEIKVMLDGQGADEQFAGYNGFYSAYLGELIRSGKLHTWFKETQNLKSIYKYSSKDIIKDTVKYIIPNNIKAKLKLKLDKGIFNWVDVDEKYYKSYLDKLYRIKIDSLKSYSINQLLYESLPKLLRYEDRDSMAFSIEARVPFLDHELVEYVVSLDSKYKIKNAVTKYCLRDCMKDILPTKIIERKDKLGFVTPEEVWIRENKDYFRELFIDSCDRLIGLVDSEKAMDWFDNMVNSKQKLDFTIWRIISAGIWIKVFDVKL